MNKYEVLYMRGVKNINMPSKLRINVEAKNKIRARELADQHIKEQDIDKRFYFCNTKKCKQTERVTSHQFGYMYE